MQSGVLIGSGGPCANHFDRPTPLEDRHRIRRLNLSLDVLSRFSDLLRQLVHHLVADSVVTNDSPDSALNVLENDYSGNLHFLFGMNGQS